MIKKSITIAAVVMKVGDLIYDSAYGQYGLVIEVPKIDSFTSFISVLYGDGQVDNNLRTNDCEIEVISESR